jgi:hypothetical protein
MNAIVTLCLLCSTWGAGSTNLVTTDQVDLIEYNHLYDEQGRHVLDQVIFYEWSRGESRFQIRDWRLIKSNTQLPRHDAERGIYIATWHEGQTLRQVRATSLRETWTQYDPELIERSYLPKEQRRELTRQPKRDLAAGK